jgi:hypothetical protein
LYRTRELSSFIPPVRFPEPEQLRKKDSGSPEEMKQMMYQSFEQRRKGGACVKKKEPGKNCRGGVRQGLHRNLARAVPEKGGKSDTF